jgi:serine/threonine-protein kinase
LEEARAVWVAELDDREALLRLIRAALTRSVAPVALPTAHLTAGAHILQIRLHGKPVVVLSAELAGETATGAYALRLTPLDGSHVPELIAISEADDMPTSSGPMSATARSLFEKHPPLARGGSLTLPLETRPPRPLRPPAETVPDDDDDDVEDTTDSNLEASVLFDPEAALISRAPARPEGAGAEDTLTIPVRSSMMPGGPAAMGEVPPSARSAPPPKPPPSGPHTISHLSIPSVVSSSASIPSAVPVTERQDVSISIEVDFDTSQSNVHTERFRPEWNADDGSAASDPSLAGSVVFDPDVLAREQSTASAKPSRPPPPSIAKPADDDLSMTPTVPMELPARRPPSMRRAPSSRRDPIDLDQPVNEDAETFPRSVGRHSSVSPPAAVSAAGVPSIDAGPRTMRRNTGAHGIVIVGRVIANRYRIESLVGAGAIGAVYKATHVDLPRTFAIKVLHPHFRADAQLLSSFRTEARAASLLDHPNVTVVHDFGEEPDGLVYIVMEYLAGTNLQAVLDAERRIEPRRAITIMAQVCSALSAAHERGIVHRDVKPDNIMLVPSRDDEGRPFEMVKVCDFGIAALETTPGAVSGQWTAGTPEYMAPEQAQGRADARTDIYACGIVLYEMVTGRPPFVGDTPAATVAKHMTEAPRRPSEIVPGLPPALEAVILCAIEKLASRRFPTMRDLRTELKRLL